MLQSIVFVGLLMLIVRVRMHGIRIESAVMLRMPLLRHLRFETVIFAQQTSATTRYTRPCLSIRLENEYHSCLENKMAKGVVHTVWVQARLRCIGCFVDNCYL
jgi:hypothetical protein